VNRNAAYLLGAGAAVVLLLLFTVSSYNGLVAARTGVDTQANQVGVAYARKLDLIPQITDIAKQYLANESEVQTKVAALRSGSCAAPATVEQYDACDKQVTQTNDLIIKVVNENYPNLKSFALYANVQTEMVNSQNKISAEQGIYNDLVGSYNTKVQSFPTNLMAGLFGFQQKAFIGTKTTGGSNAALGTNNLNG
jgi:LemA protein